MAYMYDKTLILDVLEQVIEASEVVEERCVSVTDVDYFIDTKDGQKTLDSICMKLIAVGESIKNIDSITDKSLLDKYPQIEWRKIKGIRDFISHHYFDLDAEVIYGICKNNINDLLAILQQIKKDLLS